MAILLPVNLIPFLPELEFRLMLWQVNQDYFLLLTT
jgi:hypothetical protein